MTADELDRAWIHFDPLAAIPPEDDHEWYQDLWNVRGTDNISRRIARQIARPAPSPQRVLLLGHTGSGKSTELGRIQRTLEAGGHRCVVVDAERDLDREDVALPDVQMLIVEQTLKLASALEHTLSDKTLASIRAWFFEEEWVEESRRGAGLGLGDLISRLTGLRADFKIDVEKRKTLRSRVERRLSAFIDLVRELLGEATEKLQLDGFKGLVVLVDGLEKAAVGSDGRKRSVKMLFEQAAQWQALGVPLVITAPLELLSESERIGHYYQDFHLVPAIPVRPRPDVEVSREMQRQVAESHRLLRALADRRAPIDRLFTEPALFDRLVDYSGGSIRDLFRLLRLAIDIAQDRDATAIDADVVAQAWKEHAIQVGLVLKLPADLEPLQTLQVDASHLNYDKQGISLLQRELVLPYINGGKWFGVHPAITRHLG